MPTLSLAAVVPKFAAYHIENADWGPLHIVMEDGNVDAASIVFCMNESIRLNDRKARLLCHLLIILSKTQRKKLPHEVRRYVNEWWEQA